MICSDLDLYSAPDPALFVSGFQDAYYTFCRFTYSSLQREQVIEVTKQLKLRLFLIFFAC